MSGILIRADDLGYSEAVNLGIAKSVNEGVINNVGVMVNMPWCEEGLRLLKKDVCLGLHVNICAGPPLCQPEEVPSLVNADGEFKASREYRSAKTDFVDLDEVVLEIETQYGRFVELTGGNPGYFEAHAVQSENLRRGLEIVAKRYNLKYCAFPVNGEPVVVGKTKMYMHMEAMKPGYEPFAAFKRMVENAHTDGCDIFVCHPGYLDAYILRSSSLTTPRPFEAEMACSREMREFLAERAIRLLTYWDM